MVFYEYVGDDGDRLDRDFPMGTAPEAFRSKGKAYRRYFSASSLPQRPKNSKPIVANSLPDRRVMPEELHGKIDSWSPEGAPVFTSKASAHRFGEESKRLHAAGKIDKEWHFDSAPSGAEVREIKEAEVKKYRADMLKRPRPKDL